MSIFQKIIAGEIPCHRVYEDEHVLAFLDINPLAVGHVLVIPKEAKAAVDELSDESAAALGRALPRIARAVRTAVGATAYNILCNNGAAAGQEVMHVHFHVIPKTANGGLQKTWRPGPFDHGEGARLAARLRELTEGTAS